MFEITRPADVTETEFNAAVLSAATAIIERQLSRDSVESPSEAADLIRMKLHGREHEVFAALFLDTRHRVIEYAELFRGSIDSATVHAREVVKDALTVNAAAVIFAHNHPSGVAEPSSADIAITKRLIEALALVEVRVLDHIVVGTGEAVSMAARGLL